MSDLEKALTAAIRAMTDARRAMGDAAIELDRIASDELKYGDSDGLRASGWAMDEGVLNAHYEMLSCMLSSLRRMRKEAR